MEVLELIATLDRLDASEPRRSRSEKRERLAAVRERLLAIKAKGHSWRAMAAAISTAWEKVTPDLLRDICVPKRRKRRAARRLAGTTTAGPSMRTGAKRLAKQTPPNNETFGAKGLRL